jgi:hypothetical protein
MVLLFVMISTKKEIQSKQICMEYSSLGFSLVCWLSAFAERSSEEIALVYTGPDDSDMLVSAIVLGLLAPAIAFSIAFGSGLAAATQVFYSAQNFGMNNGNGIAVSPIADVPSAGHSKNQQKML